MSSTNASLSNIAKNQGAKTLNTSKKAMNKQVKGFKDKSFKKNIYNISNSIIIFIFIILD